MPEIKLAELHFLVALLASEEAYASELKTDLVQRGCDGNDLLGVLRLLISARRADKREQKKYKEFRHA